MTIAPRRRIGTLTWHARWSAGALVMAAALALAGCGSREERIASGLLKGAEFVRVADWDKAGLEVRNVLQIDPKSAQAYYLSGKIDEGRLDMQRAFGAYSKVIELMPGHIDAKAALGRIYLLAGDRANAGDLTRQVLAAEPGNAAGRTLQAALRAAEGDVPGARKLAEAVLADGRGNQADASMLLAGLHANAGDTEAAHRVIETALTLDPGNLQLLQVAAQLATPRRESGAPAVGEAQGKALQARAEGHFRRLTELAPKNAQYWTSWAAWHDREGRRTAAEEVLAAAARAVPDDGARHMARLNYIAARRGSGAAITGFEQAIAERPRDAALRLRLAELLRSSGRADDADRVLEAAIERYEKAPPGLQARAALATARHAAGRSADATVLLAQILAESPRDAAALALRGRLHLEAGRAAEAVGDLRAALKDQPGSAEVVGRLAKAHEAAAEHELARQVLADAVRFAPQNLDLHLMLSAYLIDRRDWPAATQACDAALRAAPADLRAHDMRALLALAQRDTAGAERVYANLKSRQPDDAAPYLRLAQMHERRGRPDAALKEYDAAMRANPRDGRAAVAAFGLTLSRKQFDAAAARLQVLARTDPSAALVAQLEGDLAMARGLLRLAQDRYQRLIDLAPDRPAGYVQVARALAAQNQMPAALALLSHGEKATPDDITVSLARAEWLSRLGRHDEAIALYERLYLRAPQDETVANNLGYLLAETRSDPASLQRALSLAERFANSTGAGPLDTLGWARYRAGDYGGAVTVLERASALAPDSALIRLHLGMALHRQGDLARARALLKSALAQAGPPLPNAGVARDILEAG